MSKRAVIALTDAQRTLIRGALRYYEEGDDVRMTKVERDIAARIEEQMDQGVHSAPDKTAIIRRAQAIMAGRA